MTSADISHDVYRSRLQTVVESLRYWIPSVADAARVEEMESPGYWKMIVTPRVSGACPFELLLRTDRRFDIMIGGETYEDLEMMPFEEFLPLAEAISQGRVLQRRWVSTATRALREVETLVTFAKGKVWSQSRIEKAVADHVPRDAAERQDRHFLPYRR